ncbi:hypothetical protein TR74_02490, partial [Carbonactinospora thermoautotrophica]
ALTAAEVRATGGSAAPGPDLGGGAEERLARLADACRSDLEQKFLRFLDERRYRLPDEAQTLVPEAVARPDFVYRLPGGDVAVFVDGPYHDAAEVAERDLKATYRLEEQGWLVIRIRHDDEWDTLVREYPSVFGPGRGER